jgi:streptogramin lyase
MDSYSKTRAGLGALCVGLALTASCSKTGKPAAADAPPAAPPPPADLSIPGTGVFPESLSSSADGSVYIGSVGKAQIYKVAPGGSEAQSFIAPASGGIKQVFGVFVDDSSGTLWACSNELAPGGPGAAPPKSSALHGFELATGTPKASYAFPKGGFCNDVAIGPGGELYATDTNGMQVMRLPKDGKALEVWSPPGAFGPAGGVLDGIAVVGGRVFVNTLLTSKLFAVEIAADGKAGKVTEVALSAPLQRPDGMRSWGNELLLADGSGRILRIAINGDSGTVTPVKTGLDGVVAVTVVGKTGYALEGQLAIMMAPPGTTPPAEKPYRAVAFTLP